MGDRSANGWETRLDAELIARHVASGAWTGTTLAGLGRDRARDRPDVVAVHDDNGARTTFGEIHHRATGLAAALAARGFRPGEVISFQLPNWHEAMIVNLAANMLGLVVNPIVPIYRDSEVEFILRDARSRAIFITPLFRGFDYVAMIERLRPRLDRLDLVVLVRGGAADGPTLDALIAEGADLPALGFTPDPNAVKLLLYTSGTTGRPKGVLHSSNTLGAEIRAIQDAWAIRPDDVMLMPSPVTHITGYLNALELPFAAGIPVALMETWDADRAVEIALALGTTLTIGATPFLVELAHAAERRSVALASMRLFACGGAPVPPEAIERAARSLPRCACFRVFGMSEAPTVSVGLLPGDDPRLGATTDGRIWNHEVRICDPATGEPLPDGAIGEICTRGPEVMIGYTDPAETRAAFDDAGYFRTGDLGFVSEDGFLSVSGRKKDLIIRGGENLSPREIEDVLHRHPAILEAAVVAMPHARLGETPMAYVVVRRDHQLTFETMIAFLDEHRLARQKHPEKLVVLDEMPRTTSGKIMKHLLRQRNFADA